MKDVPIARDVFVFDVALSLLMGLLIASARRRSCCDVLAEATVQRAAISALNSAPVDGAAG
jgi:hypothetical protein